MRLAPAPHLLIPDDALPLIELFRMAWDEAVIDFRRRILALPNATASQVVGKSLSEIHSVLNVEVDRCLNDLANTNAAEPTDRALEKFQKLHPENTVEK